MQGARIAAICATLPLWQGLVVAAVGVTVDARANIYTAGRSTPFNGVLPQHVRFAAGAGKTLRILNTSGEVGCTKTDPMHGAEGGVCLGRTQTNIYSLQGISGIRHDGKTLFLLGVFLDDTTPADPAPAVVNFTGNDEAAVYTPLLRQTFFIGDGKTSGGVVQQFRVPATATRLFLGFADGGYVVGVPGAYEDNAGAITAEVDLGGVAFCSQGVEPAEIAMAGAGGVGTVRVNAQGGCAWTAVSNASWITGVTRGASQVDFGVAANAGGTRSGTLTVAGLTVTVNQTSGAVACVYALGASSASAAIGGGTGSVTVTAMGGCLWTAVSGAGWITVTSGASGNGTGVVRYSVEANAGPARTGTLTIAGRMFSVSQAGGACTYAIAPESVAFAPAGGDYEVAVTAGSGCRWTAVSGAGWLSVVSGSEGSGNGRVVLRVAVNSGGQRTGTVTIAGRVFTVVQMAAGCVYTIAPESAVFPQEGEDYEVAVTAGSGCRWTAASSAAWVAVLYGGEGSGSGRVVLRVAVNPGAERRGTVTIAGRTFTAVQRGTGGCSYAVAPESANFSAYGGTGEIAVTAGSGCGWTATSGVGWMGIRSGASGQGGGRVVYSVAANAAGQRVGSLTVAGQRITVTQAGAPAVGQEPPEITQGGVVNDADLTAVFAPGSVVRIYGEFLYRGTRDFGTPPYPVEWEGLTVEVVDGATMWRAPLLLLSPFQIVAQVPYEVPARVVQLRVRNTVGVSNAVGLEMWECAPRVYTGNGGTGAAFALREGGVVTDAAPAKGGEAVAVFAVGLGAVNPAVASGAAAGRDPFHDVVERVTVNLDGRPAELLYAYLLPGLVGIYEVDFRVPEDVREGWLPLSIAMGGHASQSGVTLRTASMWRDAATLVLSAEGGSASGGGVTITAGSRVFAGRVEVRVQRGANANAVRLAGLPASTAGPLRLTLESEAALDANGTYVRMKKVGDESREAWFRGEVSGNRVTITLPARVGAETKAARGAEEAEELLLELMLGIRTTGRGRFEALSTDEAGETAAAHVLSSLEGAAAFAARIGLGPLMEQALGTEPFAVQLAPWEARYAATAETIDGWKDGFPQMADARDAGILLSSPWNEGRYSLKVVLIGEQPNRQTLLPGHMLLHAAMNMAEPGRKAAKEWMWLQEAVAVLYEDAAEAGVMHANLLFPGNYRGLEQEEGGLEARQVGRGASMFVTHLMEGGGGQALVGNLFRTLRLLYDRPVGALRAALTGPGLEREWVEFAAAMMRRYDKVQLAELTSDYLRAGVGTAERQRELYDLSASLVRVALPADLPTDTKIFVELVSEDEKPVAVVRRLEGAASVDRWDVRANEGRRQITDIDWKRGEQLLVSMVQPRFGEVNRKTRVTLRVVLESETQPVETKAPFEVAPDRAQIGFSAPMFCNGQRCGVGYYDTKGAGALESVGQRLEMKAAGFTVSARFDPWTKLASFSMVHTRPLYMSEERVTVELRNVPCVWNRDSHAQCSVSRAEFDPAVYVARYELVQLDATGKEVGRGTPDWSRITAAFPVDILFKHRQDP
ncbi:MAG: hypothetical protein JNK48_18105 [Bryobacterales bacterium]|nr:hypothetical protein [Bryobacterales bacterium]